ncbi:MAG: hypothetical protein JGK26_04580 [Microcoleus sp. PH2017_27_LUM_O_A]|uniref:hypothetical protein n=1 Tax=unclassified Microcoleus TaxID=2642155 RepID=UPI001D34F82A|nr:MULTISPECIES: hypothetical protein [unclassified Microcoleus]MCC3459153.1 hypothetical protein [Microcoleus sp. PH2017_11_PCY_U_A]MCC3558405.1 hypothetical protein [Microcoleus sp. PH2017_27_LUM_O_A]
MSGLPDRSCYRENALDTPDGGLYCYVQFFLFLWNGRESPSLKGDRLLGCRDRSHIRAIKE